MKKKCKHEGWNKDVVSLSAGLGGLIITNINYCPHCGKKLENTIKK